MDTARDRPKTILSSSKSSSKEEVKQKPKEPEHKEKAKEGSVVEGNFLQFCFHNEEVVETVENVAKGVVETTVGAVQGSVEVAKDVVGTAKGAVTSTLDTATETAVDNLIRSLKVAQKLLANEDFPAITVTSGVNIMNTVHMDFQIQLKKDVQEESPPRQVSPTQSFNFKKVQ